MQSRKREPERQSFSVVVLGDFNPSIFHPIWFSNNGLVPAAEAENAEIIAIQKGFSLFSVGAMRVQVDESRLILTTVDSPSSPVLRDLALGTLTILEHTPLRAMGFNFDMKFGMESREAWHEVGHRLVPKTDWNQLLESPGMRQVIVEGKRSGCTAHRVQVRVQPTPEIEFGILVGGNQHYALESEDIPKEKHTRMSWRSRAGTTRRLAIISEFCARCGV